MRIPLLLAFCAPFFGSISRADAASTRYISPGGNDAAGDGSRDKPWKTIRFASDHVADDGAAIILLDGIYEGSQSIGRHFTQPCTIRAENPYRARLKSPADRNRVFYCYDGSNVKIQGLEMFGSGATAGEYMLHIGGPKVHDLTFEDCTIHDSYNNDLIKINDLAQHILFKGCIFFNQTDHGGDEHFDINTVTNIAVEDSIFFNDYAGSGRKGENQGHAFIVIKNSSSKPDITQRIALRRNIFLNWQGRADAAFILLGEDGKPFFEAQQVMIENNIFIHNSPNRLWSTLLMKGGLRDITFRANTIVGHPLIRATGGLAAACFRIDQNPPMGDMTFCNNIWCDTTGEMARFSMSNGKVFAVGSKQVISNNLYWNAGKKISTTPDDVLVPDRDPKKLVADPRLPDPSGQVLLPRLDPATGRFPSGQTSIRGEFERLVNRYARPGQSSPAAGAADPANMPQDDILGHPRGPRPDMGCCQRTGND
jgi:hypothetical protein